MGKKSTFSKLKKKGIILNETVVLIVGLILMLVIIFGILYYTGFLKNITASMQGLICMMSAYFRGFAVSILWVLLSSLILLLTLTALSMSRSSAPVEIDPGVSTVGYNLLAGAGSIAKIAFYAFLIQSITALLGHIPLMCPAMSNHMGSFNNPMEGVQFSYALQSMASDCWDMYGAGAFNPLMGISPPNPRICFLSNVFMKDGITMRDAYEKMIERKPDWKLSFQLNENPKIKLFCPYDMGFDPLYWDSCLITNKTIYVSYKDEHPYVYIPGVVNNFGTGICSGHMDSGGKLGGGKFSGGGDYITICVDNLNIAVQNYATLPTTIGDGFCNPLAENCENSPVDCRCDYGQKCMSGGICDYCGLSGDYCDASAVCCDEFICDTTENFCRQVIPTEECHLRECSGDGDCCVGYRCYLEPGMPLFQKCVPLS